jgi:hypothetical protein
MNATLQVVNEAILKNSTKSTKIEEIRRNINNQPSYRKMCWRNGTSRIFVALYFPSLSATQGTHLWPAKEERTNISRNYKTS